jgi:LytS/YehU family sensor histidine kinase
MEHRWDARYELITENICEGEKIPPLIFHTLIENGFTHAFKPKEDGKFWLNCDDGSNKLIFTLKNDGSLIQDFSTDKDFNIDEGMGIKYIKSRLEERYPGKWALDFGVHNSLWQVKIIINK